MLQLLYPPPGGRGLLTVVPPFKLGHDASMTDDSSTRHLIFREGVPTRDGRVVQPGAIQLPEDDDPKVVMVRDREAPTGFRIHGYMSDFHRDANGDVTVVCTPDIPENHTLAVEFGSVELKPVGDDIVLTKGEVMAALAVTDPSVWME